VRRNRRFKVSEELLEEDIPNMEKKLLPTPGAAKQEDGRLSSRWRETKT
jgi:hypothetical protein